MDERIELWVCEDCLIIEETGDYTGFDYHYDKAEAAQRIKECDEGWAALKKRGYVGADWGDPSEPQVECRDCAQVGQLNAFSGWTNDDGAPCTHCPSCGSTDVRERDHGVKEFSWRSCDCCDSGLGGSRHRYALFPATSTDKESA